MKIEKTMRKRTGWLLILGLLFLTACGGPQAKETMQETKEITSVPGALAFSFPEEWLLKEEDNNLLAENPLTGSSISITYEDLAKRQGGTLIRIQDYLEAIQENLQTAGDYSYSLGLVETKEVYGEQYHSFRAEVPALDGRQYFYVRRIEDTMMVMTVTLFGEDTLETVLQYGRAL